MSASVDVTLDQGAPDPAARFADVLVEALGTRRGGVLTWLNHFSALQSLNAGVPVDSFDYLGVDGVLLGRLVGAQGARTSADRVLPVLFQRSTPLRIALIGSTTENLAAVAEKIERDHGHSVVLVADGYAGLPEPAMLRGQLRRLGVQLVVVGLGAPRQDLYALQLRVPGVLVATCGGWLDQFAGPGEYYPSWAYPLRLNWLVRLAREPRRLWRRYTVDAVRALLARRALTVYITERGGTALRAAESGRPASLDRPAA